MAAAIQRSVPAAETTRRLTRAIGALGENHEQVQRVFAALRELHDGAELARSLARDIWDFAVEFDQLQRRGVHANDLRWLVFKGWICHGHETTTRSSSGRCFRLGGPHRFDQASCFVLSHIGANLLADQPATTADLYPQTSAAALDPLVPRWDRQRQELRLAQYLIKRFKVPAQTQCAILSAFEEEDWPVRIDDPLPGHPELDPKRRLHNAINALNRNQVHRLIRFLGDGRGLGVRWEFKSPSAVHLKLGRP
jgi:hypothetical protein